jgi:F420-dependent oxidoreductase-like protein
MRFGLLMESQEGLTWADLLRVAGSAESLGLDGVYVSDHYGPVNIDDRRDVLPAWMEVAVLAARTSRIRLGPLVSPVTFRHPVDLAHQAMSIDVLSGGRLDLGMGAGWHEDEHIRFGRPFPPAGVRMAMLEESLEVVTRLWEGTQVNWQGEFYRLENATILPRPLSPEPPIILGGWGPRMLALAARYAREWNCFYKSVDEVVEAQEVMDATCRSVGRDPATLNRSLMTPLIVGRSEADVEERIARHREVFAGLPSSLQEWRASGFVGGTVTEVREQLERLAGCGISRVIFEFNDVQDVPALELLVSDLAGS